MAIHSVSSTSELKAALARASGGDVVELAAGDYGNLSLRSLDYDSEVTIRSFDPDDPAVFNTINITSSSNVTFDSLFIDFTPNEGTVSWSSAFRAAQGVSNITLRNSKIEGGDSIAGISPDSEPGEQGKFGILGEPIGRGITMAGRNIVIENNDISHFRNGIVMSGVDNSILNNEIYDLRTTPVRGDGSNLTIDGNYFHDSNPWKIGGAGDHGTYVHLWTNKGGQPMSNITITNNVFSDEDGGSLLGIHLADRHDLGYTNVTVEDNVIHSRTGQAIRFQNVSDGSISRNTILNPDNAEMRGTPLVMVDETKNIRLEDNIFSTFWGEATQQAFENKGFVFNNNLDVDYSDPNAENYFGRILADSRLEGSALWEQIVVPGSVADGLGSARMHLSDSPARLTPVFAVERADRDTEDLVLRADLSRGPDGPVNASDAQFIWDFGDGTGATGQVVRHAYADAGRFEATLTVVMPDGTTAKATSEIGIAGADILSFDPQTGLFEAEGFGTAAAIAGSDRASVDFGSAHGIDLGGTGSLLSVGKQHLSRLFGAESFEMSMTLRADTLGSTGEVARVHGNFIVSVAPRGEVRLQLWTDAQSKSLTTTGVTVNDGADHDIRISFDGETNNLRIYVDDQLAGATEIEGAMRRDYPRDLMFGNPWNRENFDGTLSAFQISAPRNDFPLHDGSAVIDQGPETVMPEEDGSVAAPPESDAPDSSGTPNPSDPGEDDTDASMNGEDADNPDTPEPSEADETDAGTSTGSAPQPEEEAGQPGPLLLDGYRLDFASLPGSDTVRLHYDTHVVETEDGPALVFDGTRDFVSLGRLTEFEASQRLAFSVDFTSGNPDSGAERLVWNHFKVGLTLEGDGLRVHVQNAQGHFNEGFYVDDLGLNDGERHSATVMVDAETDRLQVVVNDVLVLDERDTDFDFVGASGFEWGWSLGTVWNRWFEGQVHDFQVSDDFTFVETPTDDGTILA